MQEGIPNIEDKGERASRGPSFPLIGFVVNWFRSSVLGEVQAEGQEITLFEESDQAEKEPDAREQLVSAPLVSERAARPLSLVINERALRLREGKTWRLMWKFFRSAFEDRFDGYAMAYIAEMVEKAFEHSTDLRERRENFEKNLADFYSWDESCNPWEIDGPAPREGRPSDFSYWRYDLIHYLFRRFRLRDEERKKERQILLEQLLSDDRVGMIARLLYCLFCYSPRFEGHYQESMSSERDQLLDRFYPDLRNRADKQGLSSHHSVGHVLLDDQGEPKGVMEKYWDNDDQVDVVRFVYDADHAWIDDRIESLTEEIQAEIDRDLEIAKNHYSKIKRRHDDFGVRNNTQVCIIRHHMWFHEDRDARAEALIAFLREQEIWDAELEHLGAYAPRPVYWEYDGVRYLLYAPEIVFDSYDELFLDNCRYVSDDFDGPGYIKSVCRNPSRRDWNKGTMLDHYSGEISRGFIAGKCLALSDAGYI